MVGLYVMQRVHVMYMVVLGAVGGSFLWNYVLQCVGIEVQWSGAREQEQCFVVDASGNTSCAPLLSLSLCSR